MRILIVEHHDKPTVGVIGETLRDLGVEMETLWGASGEAMPSDHADYDGIVVLGGVMAATDDERCPYFPALTNLIRDFAEADKPVLGVCLGSQLIARAFGGDLHVGRDLEFGFHTVAPTPVASTDPVMRHLTGPMPLFQWHTDHYALPPDAERLATGEQYDNQAYRIGRVVYGMQFHFEVRQAIVQEWIEDTPGLDAAVPDHREWLPAQFAAYESASVDFCRTVVRSWAALR